MVPTVNDFTNALAVVLSPLPISRSKYVFMPMDTPMVGWFCQSYVSLRRVVNAPRDGKTISGGGE